ncbi:MAG: EscU/YscU/HrcU family type III secretion system export apparatus switch protein [Candidatus Margulisbacteria bacterium]|nr:EscU/YscU/HrcU family type III secretion system export apparatus switch protein [Candidatus Margulisiibacteriota bacterium]MBU1616945.1 EscU/YscU/HrcU family type III secretion system export apparatus switch protein [Candidatus Margulisiibacteriota bacterium]MBU1867681.1 EscU/YscU/HrcU family type III secretion system export apparatus switch protein [Candidatus Margulisiibacteriota bacterium]
MAEEEKQQPNEGEKKPERKTVVAVRYDIDRDKAPMVLATGKGMMADEILRIAEENKIPLYEDPELAKLLAKLEIDSEIPPELYTLVAEVLFFVFKLDRMAEKREKVVTRLREEKKEKARKGE